MNLNLNLKIVEMAIQSTTVLSVSFFKFIYIYAPLAYITHLTDSCAFSKFACIWGGRVLLLCEGFADFQVLVGYFKITNQLYTHWKKLRYVKTAIAAEQKVVLSFWKQIWNRYFKCYILFFMLFFQITLKCTFGV